MRKIIISTIYNYRIVVPGRLYRNVLTFVRTKQIDEGFNDIRY